MSREKRILKKIKSPKLTVSPKETDQLTGLLHDADEDILISLIRIASVRLAIRMVGEEHIWDANWGEQVLTAITKVAQAHLASCEDPTNTIPDERIWEIQEEFSKDDPS